MLGLDGHVVWMGDVSNTYRTLVRKFSVGGYCGARIVVQVRCCLQVLEYSVK
jgi:hypothetical protein